MKKIVFIFLLLLVTPALAEVPDYNDIYVNDYANIFTQNQTAELRTLLAGVEEETTAEITILTVETVSPMSTSQYAQEVFDKWKIGKEDKDNGLLILYTKTEDKIWVQTGYGLEGILPDSKVGRILDETFVIERANNNSANGIILATEQYVNIIFENKDEVLSGETSDEYYFDYLIFFIYILIFLVFTYQSYISRYPKCPKCKSRSDLVSVHKVYSDEKDIFGHRKIDHYIATYKCRKCNETFKKKMKRDPRRSNTFIFIGGSGGGFGGGGFGGGFGGGGSGGGGAGR